MLSAILYKFVLSLTYFRCLFKFCRTRRQKKTKKSIAMNTLQRVCAVHYWTLTKERNNVILVVFV